MKNNVRLIDIAKKAGVSLGTVDRVVNGRGNVAQETENRVREILKEFNYQPNLMASSLASRKKLRLAILLPEPWEGDYWQKIMEGIRKAGKEIAGFGAEISWFLYEQYNDLQYREFAGEIIKLGFEGVLTAPVFHQETMKMVKELEDHQIPYVFIDSGMEGARPLCSISQDVFRSGSLAARLIDYGLAPDDELLMVSIRLHPDNPEHSLARSEGFRHYFDQKKHPGRKIHQLEIVNPKYEMLSSALDDVLGKHPAIRGIFINNSKAFMIARYLADHGLTDLRLVGYDLIGENVKALRSGFIDFLIYDQSENQGEIGLNVLFDHLAKRKNVPLRVSMPVHIAANENLEGILPGQESH